MEALSLSDPHVKASSAVGIKRLGSLFLESIAHDSTEEKLFAKASDAALSRAFRELGLKSLSLKERAGSADVLAKSPIYGDSDCGGR